MIILVFLLKNLQFKMFSLQSFSRIAKQHIQEIVPISRFSALKLNRYLYDLVHHSLNHSLLLEAILVNINLEQQSLNIIIIGVIAMLLALFFVNFFEFLIQFSYLVCWLVNSRQIVFANSFIIIFKAFQHQQARDRDKDFRLSTLNLFLELLILFGCAFYNL